MKIYLDVQVIAYVVQEGCFFRRTLHIVDKHTFGTSFQIDVPSWNEDILQSKQMYREW
jgi:hypothetical protein